MTTEAQTVPDSGPLTLDQFAAAMVADPKPAKEEPAVTDVEEEPDPDNAGAEGADTEEEAEGVEVEEPDAEEEEPEKAEPVPDPPQSWGKDDAEAWKELTPKAREVVLRREQQNIKAMADVQQKVSQAGKAVQALAAQTEQIASLATSDFEKRWGKGEEGEVDWVKLAQLTRDHPDQYDYASTRAAFEAERADLKRANQAASQQSELARRTYLAEQSQELAKIAPELVDAKEGKARREKTFAWLAEQGFTQDVLADISAVELKIAHKAMRFDEAEAAAKKAAALPRKNPIAASAKPVKPAGTGEASPQRNLQALSAKLTKSGRLEDFVALEVAEEEQRARKQARK